MAKEYEQILSHVQFHATIHRLPHTQNICKLYKLTVLLTVLSLEEFRGWEGWYYLPVN